MKPHSRSIESRARDGPFGWPDEVGDFLVREPSYQRVDVGLLRLVIDVPDSYGAVTYNIACPLELFFVRGDAAVLSPGQDHSSARWYLRRCDDLSAPIGARRQPPQTDAPLAATPITWGQVRAHYLH